MVHRIRVVAGAVASAAALGLTVVAAPAARADSFDATWKADATTTVRKLGQTVSFPTTGFTATITPQTDTTPATITGPLVLPRATSSLRLGSLELVTMTLQVADPTPVKGTIRVDGPVWHISAHQGFRVKVLRISPLGSPLINLVHTSACQTGVTTARLKGTVDFTRTGSGGPADYTMSGSYPIPAFSGCGPFLDGLLTGIVSGPDNALAVHFTG